MRFCKRIFSKILREPWISLGLRLYVLGGLEWDLEIQLSSLECKILRRLHVSRTTSASWEHCH